MPMFVDPNARVPVTDGQNTIYIKARMDIDTRAAVQNEVRAAENEVTEETVVSHIGSYRRAMLLHNIVAWEGPAFAGIPCTRENIGRLDPQEPLIVKVAQEIGRQNAPREAPDPNAVTPSGDTVSGA
jgi:hypothetical protein